MPSEKRCLPKRESEGGVSTLGLITFISISTLPDNTSVEGAASPGTKFTAEAAVDSTAGSASSSITEGGELSFSPEGRWLD